MPYEQARQGAVLMLCWTGTPAAQEVFDALALVEHVCADLGRAPLLVSTNHETPALPPEQTRSAFLQCLPRILGMSAEVHFVPGGPAMMRAVIRSALSTALFATAYRKRVHIHDTFASAVSKLHERGELDLGRLRTDADGVFRELLRVTTSGG
jgi:hypothetical protein